MKRSNCTRGLIERKYSKISSKENIWRMLNDTYNVNYFNTSTKEILVSPSKNLLPKYVSSAVCLRELNDSLITLLL